ncbi:hypothetical protein OZX57_00425 [Bifidobacterium sp. ESL0682]|uniref:hypothetical protein n=1 Tax=Bifidobacterium sp. ESL0682 TaxID=2983212 RepID=UPI0023F76859|nr:hypothetical protein [Bifidobacterium sp. ESL0682]WEV42033.1 hypothetical protein OZX57_00425 [Bifidobacterium sp. ESL0682]
MKKLGKAVVASIAAACTLFAGAGFANAGEAPSGTPSQVSVRSMYNKTRLQSAYNAVLAIANGNTARNYKQSSWMVMHSDMETARAMLNDANDGISHANGAMSQADVDNTANLLSGYPGIMQTAVPGEPTGADPLKSKGDLQAFYNRVKNVQESSYPGNENWASFRIARNSASYLFEPSHGNESQYEITLTYDNLYHATKELDPSLLPASHTPSHNPAPAPAPAPVPTPAPAPADPKTPLRNAYDKVKGYKQADFVASTWSAFAAERTAAKALLDNASATQAAINAETKSLNDKAAALINIAQLKSDIAKATSLKPSDYTEFSWYRVTLSLPYAKYVVANNNASKNDVDSAEGVLSSDLNGLKAPIAGQKTGADVPTSPKSKKDLAALVAQAEKLKESDYTADS